MSRLDCEQSLFFANVREANARFTCGALRELRGLPNCCAVRTTRKSRVRLTDFGEKLRLLAVSEESVPIVAAHLPIREDTALGESEYYETTAAVVDLPGPKQPSRKRGKYANYDGKCTTAADNRLHRLTSKCGRPPSLLELDTKLVSFVKNLRAGGGVVNGSVLTAAAMALLEQPSMHRQFRTIYSGTNN